MALKNIGKRVLILSDSLPLPRVDKEEIIDFEATYPFMLSQEGIFVQQVSLAGGTIDKILQQAVYFSNTKWDLVILQSGIVDCTPRPFGRYERVVLNMMVLRWPRIKPTIKKIASYLRRKRGVVYTKQVVFTEHIIALKNMFINQNILSIPIVASTELSNRINGLSINISNYNRILSSELTMLELNLLDDYAFTADGHHLNRKGHSVIYNNLMEQLRGE